MQGAKSDIPWPHVSLAFGLTGEPLTFPGDGVEVAKVLSSQLKKEWNNDITTYQSSCKMRMTRHFGKSGL